MNKLVWLLLIAFPFLHTLTAAGQCYMQTTHDMWYDANGNIVGDNATYAECDEPYAYAEVHITMPSGLQYSGSDTGIDFVEAVTQASTNSETGQGSFSGSNVADSLCWEDAYNSRSFQQSFPVCAIPVSFRQTTGYDVGGGTLHFEYAWDSSTHHLADLNSSSCTIREYVTYPGGSPFYWPSPPYAAGSSSQNPTILPSPPIPGGDGAGQDNNSPKSFRSPYVASTFTATQYFQYSCTCNNAMNVNLAGPISITRVVSQNPDGSWRFTVTKSGSSASINPLP